MTLRQMIEQQVTFKTRSDQHRQDKQIALDPYWPALVTDINQSILQGLGKYMDDFPYLSDQGKDWWSGTTILQKTEPMEGYHSWHFENGAYNNLARHVVWMIYLNDVEERVRRLNELGFDIEEMRMESAPGGSEIKIQPKVVDAGHHQRRLIRLTGLDVEENQARRLLNQIDEFALHNESGGDEEMMAHRWLSEVFEPVVNAVPRELRAKLENAELFHEVLEHQWQKATELERDVELLEAVQSYTDEILVNRRDESAYLGTTTEMITLPNPIPSGEVVVDDEEGDWRDLV